MLLYTYENLKPLVKTELGQKLIEETRKIYEKEFGGKPVPATDYSTFKRIYQTGDRDGYQAIYYNRRRRLSRLQLLALADDSYLEELENILAVILEEYTWVLPAHCLVKGSESFDYTVIDLFSAETGYALAETAFVLKEKLSSDIKSRIYAELKRRIVDNLESREQLWESLQNNWAAWCAGGVGITYLYAFPERFEMIKSRIFKCMENFLQGIPEEGVCLEGVGYWIHGFGFFAQFFDIYEQFTGEYPDILKSEKVKNSLQYIANACLDGRCYLPFADGGHKQNYINPTVSYAVKRLFGEEYALPSYYSLDEDFVFYSTENLGRTAAFRTLYGIHRYGLTEKNAVRERKTAYYQTSQIFIHKNPRYACAAKCGSNAEKHNHNDVGSFQIVVGGKGVIVDPGPPKYTWQYFKDDTVRYSEEVFVAGSMGHSVPIVDGGYQLPRVSRRQKILEVTDENFKFDFAGYYEGSDALTVDYRMLENGVRVSYSWKGIKEKITFRFLSFDRPVRTKRGWSVGVEILNKAGIAPEIKEICYKGHQNAYAKGEEIIYAVDYTVTGKEAGEAEFEFLAP